MNIKFYIIILIIYYMWKITYYTVSGKEKLAKKCYSIFFL